MDFTCRISRREYGEALRLKRKNLLRILRGLLILDLALWLLWVVNVLHPLIAHDSELLFQAANLLLYWVLMKMYLRWSVWHGYRKNRNIQSEFVVQATDAGISYTSSSGDSGTAPWSSLNYWRESKGIFLLVFPSNIFLMYPKSCMSAEQQDEFRSIVASVLTKK